MKKLIVLPLLLAMTFVFGQNDLLDELESSVVVDTLETPAFRGLKIVNLESTELAHKKDFYFIVAHRFGSIEQGISELFGLDQSTIRLSFIYGIAEGVNLSVSRSSFLKVYDFAIKYRILKQASGGAPFTVVGFNSMAINTGWEDDNHNNFQSKHRNSYYSSLLVSRKISDSFTLELAPMVVHENYVEVSDQDNTQYFVGLGFRQKLGKFTSLIVDYAAHLNRSDNNMNRDPLSVGFAIETGGHLFQLHFTNAQPMYDVGYLTRASGDWGDGDVYFGFNLSRVF
jgi:hypothetical protein